MSIRESFQRSSGPIRFRAATPEDAAAAARLMGVLGYPTSLDAMRARLDAICAHPDYHTIVAEIDGHVRGLVGLRRDLVYEADGPFVHLMAIAVDEDFQSRGIGTALIYRAEEWARAQGAVAISLTSGKHRQAAHGFYEHLGYAATGLRFTKKL